MRRTQKYAAVTRDEGNPACSGTDGRFQTASRATMLSQLCIHNFAIIKRLDIIFQPHLNILSGETGAGKSIIINAVNLILGGRASADLIRSGCKEARVEALFSFPENRFLEAVLAEMGFSFEGELLIQRTIFREGRNKIIINGAMATLQMLSRLGVVLISISGQHEHQFLLRPENHLFLLDDFGGLSQDRERLGDVFGQYQALEGKIHDLVKEIQEATDREELTSFQIQEIERAGVHPGEDEALEAEKTRLRHAEELAATVSEGYMALYESNDSVISRLSQFKKRLDKGARMDKRLESIRDAISESTVMLEDAAIALRDLQETIYADPARLEEVAERLELLNRLKRKYSETLEGILAFRNTLAATLVSKDEKKETLDQYIKEQQALRKEVVEKARALSKARKKAAGILEKAVEEELQALHMGQTRFRVRFETPLHFEENGDQPQALAGMRVDGFDRVEFTLSPNVGEALRPLIKIASGGELSRIMLALKTIMARTASVETLIFDEVDSGISGATAEVIGEKLLSLAQYHQILCITHLPQIASQGQTHFLVSKGVCDGRTQTSLSELDRDSRVQEIARLLGGRKITPSALAHARQMLGQAVCDRA